MRQSPAASHVLPSSLVTSRLPGPLHVLPSDHAPRVKKNAQARAILADVLREPHGVPRARVLARIKLLAGALNQASQTRIDGMRTQPDGIPRAAMTLRNR